MSNILSWQSLTLKNKNQKIIDDESGDIKEKTLTALLGPSGAGKTSLLNVLAGRVPSTLDISGEVLFYGEKREIDFWPKEVAYVEQSFYAYMNQTVYETIMFAAQLRVKDNDAITDETQENNDDSAENINEKSGKGLYERKMLNDKETKDMKNVENNKKNRATPQNDCKLQKDMKEIDQNVTMQQESCNSGIDLPQKSDGKKRKPQRPKKMSLEERVTKIITSLGLKNASNTKLKSVSGGELKRVSIGAELMSEPLFLFLDEPTSGLDSFSALNLIELLKEISKESTILMTVHQPSYKMSTYFDSIHVLSQSSTIFRGSIDDCIAFFDQSGYKLPENTNPCDYFLDLIAVDYTSEQNTKESIERIKKLKEKWAEHEETSEKQELSEIVVPNNVKARHTRDPFVKRNLNGLYSFFTGPTYLILWKRNFVELCRDTRYLSANVFQKIIFTLLLGLAYLQLGYSQESITSRTGVIFFILINSLFGTAGPIFNIFPSEKRIVYRERKSGLYDGFTAYIAKYTSLIIFDILFTTPYMTAVYWMTGLNPNAGRFFIFLIVIVSSVLFASSLGLTIGTISPNEKFAQVAGTTTLIIFIVFGGGFNNPNTIPGWLRWIIWISPVNYAFRGAMNNQYRGLQFEGTTGDDILARQGIDYPGVWSCLFGLWGLTVVSILLGSFMLHYLTRIQLKLRE